MHNSPKLKFNLKKGFSVYPACFFTIDSVVKIANDLVASDLQSVVINLWLMDKLRLLLSDQLATGCATNRQPF